MLIFIWILLNLVYFVVLDGYSATGGGDTGGDANSDVKKGKMFWYFFFSVHR